MTQQKPVEEFITPTTIPLNTFFALSPAPVRGVRMTKSEAAEDLGGIHGVSHEAFMHGVFGPISTLLTVTEAMGSGPPTGPSFRNASRVDVGASQNVANNVLVALPMRKPC